jgi:hypothetical protein
MWMRMHMRMCVVELVCVDGIEREVKLSFLQPLKTRCDLAEGMPLLLLS